MPNLPTWIVWAAIGGLFASAELAARLDYTPEQAARALYGGTFGTFFVCAIIVVLVYRLRTGRTK